MSNLLYTIIVATIAIGVPLGYLIFLAGVHHVEEGHAGVYWVGGALQKTISTPGYHWMIPFITRFSNVQITVQTDTIREIPCGTSGGSVIYFDKIEVVNRLKPDKTYNTIKLYGVEYDKIWIFDKIHHEINQFCSSHTLQEVYIDKFESLDESLATALQSSCDQWDTGIEIVAIRVTKPRIPESVRKNYEEVENSKTQLLVEMQKEKVAIKEEEISRLRAVIQAQKIADIAQINAQQVSNISVISQQREIMEKESQKKKEAIQNEIYLAQQKALADASYYTTTKQAEANKLKYSENYLRYVLYTSLANNTKIFFGEKIPSIFIDFLPKDQQIQFP